MDVNSPPPIASTSVISLIDYLRLPDTPSKGLDKDLVISSTGSTRSNSPCDSVQQKGIEDLQNILTPADQHNMDFDVRSGISSDSDSQCHSPHSQPNSTMNDDLHLSTLEAPSDTGCDANYVSPAPCSTHDTFDLTLSFMDTVYTDTTDNIHQTPYLSGGPALLSNTNGYVLTTEIKEDDLYLSTLEAPSDTSCDANNISPAPCSSHDAFDLTPSFMDTMYTDMTNDIYPAPNSSHESNLLSNASGYIQTTEIDCHS